MYSCTMYTYIYKCTYMYILGCNYGIVLFHQNLVTCREPKLPCFLWAQ